MVQVNVFFLTYHSVLGIVVFGNCIVNAPGLTGAYHVMTQIAPRNKKISLHKDSNTALQHMNLAYIWHLERAVEHVDAAITL